MVRRLMAPLALFALLFGLVAGSAQGVAAATAYTCPNRVCTFSVPDGYTEVSKDDTGIALQDQNTGGVFVVVLRDAPSGMSLNDLVENSIEEYAVRPAFQASDRGIEDESVNGLRGKSFTFLSNNRSGTNVLTTVYFFVNGDVFYTLYFATTPDTARAFNVGAVEVLDSFMFA